MRTARHGLPSAVGRIALVLATLVCGAMSARAQVSTHGVLKRPSIGPHTFLSSDAVPDPLVRSFVRQSLGLAQALDLQYPPIVVDGDTLLLLDGDLTYALLDFEYQHAVKDWLAARGRFGLRTRVGSEGASLITSGLQFNTAFEFGWLVRLVQTDRIALSLSADVSNRSSTVVSVTEFVEDVIAGVPDPKLTDHIPAVRGTGGLRFGWGVSRLFGLTVLFEGGYGDAVRRDADGEFVYSTGATLDFDLGAVTAVPIGIGLTYNQTSVQSVTSDSDQRTVVLRIGYTGRPDFIIGLDLMNTSARDIDFIETVHAMGVNLTMRYYF